MTRREVQLADLLVAHVRGAGVVDVRGLGNDPLLALAADDSIQVSWVDPQSLPPGCSIAATYDRSTSPASINVARDASAGRRRFSLLHEYGHHLRDQSFDVVEGLFGSPQPAALEERMCDAFASRLLIPDEARQQTFAGGVTAAAVVHLMNNSSASAQAVAVAAAESMDQPGYVVLLNRAGEAEFAARAGDVYPLRRGTAQTGLLERAARGAVGTGVASLHLGGGTSTRDLNTQTAVAPTYVVAVMVDGPAPWTKLSVGRTTYVPPREGWCDHCTEAFTSYKPACDQCGEPHCPSCDTCGCASTPVAGERMCTVCFTLQPPPAFESNRATVCRSCS